MEIYIVVTYCLAEGVMLIQTMDKEGLKQLVKRLNQDTTSQLEYTTRISYFMLNYSVKQSCYIYIFQEKHYLYLSLLFLYI